MNKINLLTSILLMFTIIMIGCESITNSELQKDEIVTLAPTLQGNVEHAPPSESGPIVKRFTSTAFDFFTDDTFENRFFIGDIVALCQGLSDEVGDKNITEIYPPQDPDRIIMKESAKVPASLWSPIPFTCPEVLAGEPIATGIAKLTATDNDLVVFLDDDNKNSNAFGFTITAPLKDSENKPINVKISERCVWDGIDLETLKCKEKFTINNSGK